MTIQPRAVWAGDDRPPVGELRGEDVRFLLVHHTASANGADPIGTMRGVYDFHTSVEKGWPDVAYNFFIDQNGEVYEARAGSLAGPVEASATGGSQGYAQLVCLLGDFTAQNPTAPALASLNATLAWLADRYSIDTSDGAQTTFVSRGSNRWPEGSAVTASTISGHRDMSQTACPGDTFYPYLVANVQREVDALRPSRIATTTTVPPAETTTVPPVSTSSENAPTTSVLPTTTEVAATAVEPTDAGATSPSAPTSVVPVEVAPTTVPASGELLTAGTAGQAAAGTGRDSSNGTALAIAATAGALALAGAAFVGIRGRAGGADGENDRSAVDPPPGGGDPLA
ncbi:peptidoglycan recognition protein family protein [Ilumatobacter nonamiensis]|uniref:peptidoglycan recognition protein family protein n=1 Tax=Ilumatobacter nonamiensis TaxID=467093 RepID=UPI00034DA4C4|nr:peptidoglycan recognition family protein [Ilumatobacter nonamiensis]